MYSTNDDCSLSCAQEQNQDVYNELFSEQINKPNIESSLSSQIDLNTESEYTKQNIKSQSNVNQTASTSSQSSGGRAPSRQNFSLNNRKVVNEIQLQDDIDDDIFGDVGDSAVMYWGQMLLELKNSSDKLLYAMCDGVKRTEIVREDFVLYTATKEDYESLSKIDVIGRLQSFLNNYVDKTLKVEYEEVKVDVSKDIEYLKSKFGEYLVIQN